MRRSRADRALRFLGRRLTRSRLLQRIVGRTTNSRGDALDAQTAVMLWLEARLAGALEADDRTVQQRRVDFDRTAWLAAPSPLDLPVRDGSIAGCDVRWYEPDGASGALVYLHGGGWVNGSLDSHDGLCRRLALQSNRVVVAVDYPMAPEHPWPAPIHAVVDVWREAREALSRFERVAMGGDSAGGNLTTCACRVLRDAGEPMPDQQFLLYPGLDATCEEPSHREFADGFMLTAESIRWYLDQFAPDPSDPLGSPGLAPDLEGLPPAIIAVAGFDPLRDEGLTYAQRLRESGVAVELFDFPGMIHGFANMDGLIDRAGAHVDTLARALL